MVKITAEYLGDLHTKAVHGPSGDSFLTDAPTDNNGKGEHFSPTDLMVTSMATCMLTIMGIYAKKNGINMAGSKVEAIKEMTQVPVRRIKKVTINFQMTKGLTADQLEALKAAAKGCPVTKSLHPDVEVELNFN